jgi:4-hydroxythreonine-4-phosphate dehydrogenase
LVIKLCQEGQKHPLVVVADPELMKSRAIQLGLPLTLLEYSKSSSVCIPEPGHIYLLPAYLDVTCESGKLNPGNARYILNTLEIATRGVIGQEFSALVTGPVNKACINDAGIEFTGHTEWLQHRTGTDKVVMMLANNMLKVALVTTHLPLKDVSSAINPEGLDRVIKILHADLKKWFSITSPRILVCGLNPHAGEGGHMGTEEIEIITPVLDRLRASGMNLLGPLPADTAFTPKWLGNSDVVLAMYHDQGLPVLKHAGFGQSVNITLGLPIIRTSVDHGTALDLAGTGDIDIGSLATAIAYAIRMSGNGRSA